ncbi:MAG TPA: hypothetical protein VK815_11980 [Candidatus Acidoferrales bacterium]|jgi:hypothetical protein|nr:hypothetical protein [Candidatus Acidoferrales bacterium]
MNILSAILKYLGPVLLLIVVFYEYKLKHVIPDGRTTEHKKTSKSKFLILFIAGILGLLALCFDDWDKSQKAKAAQTEREGLYTQITNLNSQLKLQSAQISTVNSNQSALLQQYQENQRELATNASINLDLRERIIGSNRKFEEVGAQVEDLNAWQNRMKVKLENQLDLQNVQHAKKMEAAQLEFEQAVPVYDYTVQKFVEMIGKIASVKHDKAISDYQAVPRKIDFSMGETNFSEVKLVINSNWTFHISITAPDFGLHKGLRIRCKEDFLDVAYIGGDSVDTGLHLAGQDPIGAKGDITDYKKTVNGALESLIGAELTRFPENVGP